MLNTPLREFYTVVVGILLLGCVLITVLILWGPLAVQFTILGLALLLAVGLTIYTQRQDKIDREAGREILEAMEDSREKGS